MQYTRYTEQITTGEWRWVQIFSVALVILAMLPFALVPAHDARAQFKNLSPDMMNVYACVAWAGWAHILYAFRGQGLALTRATDPQATRRTFLFVLAVVVSLAALFGVREWLGPALGEHTDQALQRLGYSAAAISALRDAGTI